MQTEGVMNTQRYGTFVKVIENSVPPCLCVLNNVTMSKGWKYGIGLGVVILLLFAGNLLVGSVSMFSVSCSVERGRRQAGASSFGNPVCPKR